MSHYMPPKDEASFLSHIIETDEDFGEETYTASRPPQYNNSNQAPGRALPSAPGAVPRTVLTTAASLADLALSQTSDARGRYPPSSYTESTGTVVANGASAVAGAAVTGGTPGLRLDLLFHINRDYNGAVQPLTERAVAALNHDFGQGPFNGNVAEWVRCRLHYPPSDPMDLSPYTLCHPRTWTVARTGSTVGSSWSMVSSTVLSLSQVGHVADDICAAGWQFDEVPAWPAGPAILDEDLILVMI
ncbi:hypothetical protein F4802DRAFT_300805 [Xylaria palmicola]|nr:hypothetical protein F4802DRAFT_300805 [Xylaria palmicola]